MLIAEDLLLLLTEDDTGRLTVQADQMDVALGGAVMLELALSERVGLTGPADPGKPGRVIVRDPSPTGDAVLDTGLAVLVERQGRKPAEVIRPVSRNLRGTLYQRLAAAGVVQEREGRILGIFPTHRWPAQDREHEARLRDEVTAALLEQTPPQARVAGLVALLHALRQEHQVVDARAHGLSRRELRHRADRIAQGDWASEALRTVVDELAAVIITTIAISAAASGTTT